ncbi:MAG: ABC transporter ATP-binding protein [Thermoplasmata archaeon]|nr:ABC transporter ATP-binding protein [Thermoplasmata archaeon]
MEIRVDGMTYGYGDLPVLHDVSLAIDEPGLVCIIGPNGVGKSTLIKCINRIIDPGEGVVFVDGHDVTDIGQKELAKVVGYVPVSTSDSFPMTVMDTVLMGRHPHQRMGSTSDLDLKIVKRTLNMMGIKHLAMRNFNELSAGQHQKVAIARGLAQTPRVLILDEPTSNLDVRHQVQVTELLHDLAVRNGMTVLMISHDLNTSAKYADKVVMMALPGIVYRVGTPQEVITEEAVRFVYGVDCRVIDDDGRPHVILKGALPDDVIREMHRGYDSMFSRRPG